MSWCPKCHYGSPTCKFPKAGNGINFTDVDGHLVSIPKCKCPQCGEIETPLMASPFGKGNVRSMHPGRAGAGKGHKHTHKEDGDALHAEVASVTGSDVKAFDYAKGQ